MSLDTGGVCAPNGELSTRVIRKDDAEALRELERRTWPDRPETTPLVVLEHGCPQRGLPEDVNRWRRSNLRHLWRGVRRVGLARALKLPTMYGALWLRVLRADGEVADLGLASLRVVTTAGVNFIVDAFQNTVELEILKYHAIGTGSTAEAAGDTALVTELTTEYTGNVRATGTTTEGASANIYRTVGTNTMDAAPGSAIREHGVFSQAATGGGTLLDRTVFAAITLDNGDSLETTYDLTLTAGS